MLRSWLLAGIFAALLPTRTALADVVRDREMTCPEGTTKTQSHGFPYCAPPMRQDCPPGYAPKVDHATAFCEPPPSGPCPKGSNWQTWTVGDFAACTAMRVCNPSDTRETIQEQCLGVPADATCEETSYCLKRDRAWRTHRDAVMGPCKTDDDCKAFPETKCVQEKRCDSASMHKEEAARIEAGKNSKSAPEPYVAKEGGPPPPYAYTKTEPMKPDGSSSSAGNSSASSASSSSTSSASSSSSGDAKPANGRCGCRLAGADDGSNPWIIGIVAACAWSLRRKEKTRHS